MACVRDEFAVVTLSVWSLHPSKGDLLRQSILFKPLGGCVLGCLVSPQLKYQALAFRHLTQVCTGQHIAATARKLRARVQSQSLEDAAEKDIEETCLLMIQVSHRSD